MIRIRGWTALGDTLYLRPFLRGRSARIETHHPELVRDLPGVEVGPVERPTHRLNAWRGGAITESIERDLPLVKPFDFSLPDDAVRYVPWAAPDVVVRPATIREAWPAPARNPDPTYIAHAVQALHRRGLSTMGVGLVDGQQEKFVGDPPPVGTARWGEKMALPPLFRSARLVVTPPGMALPLAMAVGTPVLVIGGGAGGYNAPERLVDARMNATVRWILPDPYCRCIAYRHDCNKHIPDFDAKLDEALDALL